PLPPPPRLRPSERRRQDLRVPPHRAEQHPPQRRHHRQRNEGHRDQQRPVLCPGTCHVWVSNRRVRRERRGGRRSVAVWRCGCVDASQRPNVHTSTLPHFHTSTLPHFHTSPSGPTSAFSASSAVQFPEDPRRRRTWSTLSMATTSV